MRYHLRIWLFYFFNEVSVRLLRYVLCETNIPDQHLLGVSFLILVILTLIRYDDVKTIVEDIEMYRFVMVVSLVLYERCIFSIPSG